jgi:hypothetical protein
VKIGICIHDFHGVAHAGASTFPLADGLRALALRDVASTLEPLG